MQLFLPDFHRSFKKSERDTTEYNYTEAVFKRLNDQLAIRFGKDTYKAEHFTEALLNGRKTKYNWTLAVEPTGNMIMLRREVRTLFGRRYEYPVSFVVTKQSGMWRYNFTLDHIILNRHYFKEPKQVEFVNKLIERIKSEWGEESVCYIGRR